MKTVPLILTDLQKRQIEQEGSVIYPNECCGIIFGRDIVGKRQVERLQAVGNDFESNEQFHRFSISPRQLMEAEKSAGEHGQLVLGFYHSHPDHPARPSEYDRVHAWPFYSYVIVAIAKGQPQDMTCWQLDEETERFAAQEIQQA